MDVQYGRGIHVLSEPLVFDSVWSSLEGVGKGQTILMVPGVICRYTNPRIRGVTIVGPGTGTGLRLQNTWSAYVDDVSIENFGTALVLEVTEAGRAKTNTGITQKGWPSAETPGPWGSRVTLTRFRDVDMLGPGLGLVLQNLLPSGNSGLAGEFFTATNFYGGHIAVQGQAVTIGDYVWNTTFSNTYIDITPGGGIHLKAQAWDVHLMGCYLDKNSAARAAGTPKITAVTPGRGGGSIRLTSCMETTSADIALVG